MKRFLVTINLLLVVVVMLSAFTPFIIHAASFESEGGGESILNITSHSHGDEIDGNEDVKIKWKKVSNAHHYWLTIKDTKTGKKHINKSIGNVSSYTISAEDNVFCEDGRVYKIYVAAMDRDGNVLNGASEWNAICVINSLELSYEIEIETIDTDGKQTSNTIEMRAELSIDSSKSIGSVVVGFESGVKGGKQRKTNDTTRHKDGDEYGWSLNELEPGKSYTYRAFAIDPITNEYIYGETVTISTLEEEALPEVSTYSATNVTQREAVINGELEYTADVSTEYGFILGDGTTKQVKVGKSSEETSFEYEWDGLLPNTSYMYKAYAKNKHGTVYGEKKSFTTKGDNTDPEIDHITITPDSATVGDRIKITTTACDDVLLEKVELYIDGELMKKVPAYDEEETLTYNIKSLAAGIHTVVVKATDDSGNVGDKTVYYRIEPEEVIEEDVEEDTEEDLNEDHFAPEIEDVEEDTEEDLNEDHFTPETEDAEKDTEEDRVEDYLKPEIKSINVSPNGSAIAGDEVNIFAVVYDETLLGKVELLIDGSLKKTEIVYGEGAVVSYDTSSLTEGTHIVSVRATDAAGNVSQKTASYKINAKKETNKPVITSFDSRADGWRVELTVRGIRLTDNVAVYADGTRLYGIQWESNEANGYVTLTGSYKFSKGGTKSITVYAYSDDNTKSSEKTSLVKLNSLFSDVDDDSKYYEHLKELTDKDIINGKDNGRFCPDSILTRAEGVTILCKLMGEMSVKQTATGFSDVPKSHWASGYIKFAKDNNIVDGVGGGRFAPDSSLTVFQFVKMLVSFLGYDDVVRAKYGNDSWPNGYYDYAKNELKLLKGAATYGDDTAITRSEAVILACNALHIDKYVECESSSWEYPMKEIYCTWNDTTDMSWSGYNFEKSGDHMAIDVYGKSGDVYAASKGKVVAYSDSPSGKNGRYVIIEHQLDGKTVYSFYAHLADVFVSTEAGKNEVTTSTKIGIAGGSGNGKENLYGTHLHFAIIDSLSGSGQYYGYAPTFSGDYVEHKGRIFYNPVYVVNNDRLPDTVNASSNIVANNQTSDPWETKYNPRINSDITPKVVETLLKSYTNGALGKSVIHNGVSKIYHNGVYYDLGFDSYYAHNNSISEDNKLHTEETGKVLTPAEIIYYACYENNMDIVWVLAKLQDEQSLIESALSDYQTRLNRASGYMIVDNGTRRHYYPNEKYYGFIGQVIAMTYQYRKNTKKGMTVKEAYNSYTPPEEVGNTLYADFMNSYNAFAQKMDEFLG